MYDKSLGVVIAFSQDSQWMHVGKNYFTYDDKFSKTVVLLIQGVISYTQCVHVWCLALCSVWVHQAYLSVEDLVLDNTKIHGEQARLQCGAECVPFHQPYLSIGRLVTQKMLLRRNHVLKNLIANKHQS